MPRHKYNDIQNLYNTLVDDGSEITSYPVDDGYISNAGDATIYEYNGKYYEVIVWNENAENYEENEITISDISYQYEDDEDENEYIQESISKNKKFNQLKKIIREHWMEEDDKMWKDLKEYVDIWGVDDLIVDLNNLFRDKGYIFSYKTSYTDLVEY